jgi:hypothetical protein
MADGCSVSITVPKPDDAVEKLSGGRSRHSPVYQAALGTGFGGEALGETRRSQRSPAARRQVPIFTREFFNSIIRFWNTGGQFSDDAGLKERQPALANECAPVLALFIRARWRC